VGMSEGRWKPWAIRSETLTPTSEAVDPRWDRPNSASLNFVVFHSLAGAVSLPSARPITEGPERIYMTEDAPCGASSTHARAHDRVENASRERSRLRDEHESAKGTSLELCAEASLRAANDEVAARERWLQWVEEGDY
jgi:hypothetical protein